MKFGAVPLDKAVGAILAHSVQAGPRRLRKGLALSAQDIQALDSAGIGEVVVARLEPDDLHEDTAAALLADALVPDAGAAGLRLAAPFTGRVNVLATGPGVARIDVAAINAFNAVDPMITVATVPDHQQMAAGGMVATVKIISYGVDEARVRRAASAGMFPGALRLATPQLRSAGLVLSETDPSNVGPSPEDSKGARVVAARLAALGLSLAEVRSVRHRTDAIADAIAGIAGDMVLILTASATSDPCDVAPEALRAAGGRVERFGMPVDPGNLLFLGNLGVRPVIGLPGCARSPALNGADWVLSRVACGIAVSGDDIAAMGVGGLLKEIPSRPQPRAGKAAGVAAKMQS